MGKHGDEDHVEDVQHGDEGVDHGARVTSVQKHNDYIQAADQKAMIADNVDFDANDYLGPDCGHRYEAGFDCCKTKHRT